MRRVPDLAQARPNQRPPVSRELPPVDRDPDQRPLLGLWPNLKLFERHGRLIGRETLRGLMRNAGLWHRELRGAGNGAQGCGAEGCPFHHDFLSD
jgi:hypothetical protein